MRMFCISDNMDTAVRIKNGWNRLCYLKEKRRN